ncbi:FabD/lysophospholipase-like protein [Ceraceosorus guamensis]|uniref:Lysophospholipase n=1 Tax=Ceraceosorus guamensis TaxID=1522189 RepID=A0A316W9Z3_9BASI|nr:FabD/lysophospholipase-like protein [Ceraceosorus guamensis]PWN45551.1 FabD/lysophospholipase-like protein [Ceraceosorus guamensis]
MAAQVAEAHTTAVDGSVTASDTGLKEVHEKPHSHNLWPWGHSDTQDDLSDHEPKDADSAKGEEEHKEDSDHAGLLSSVTKGLKNLSTKMRGKSHRFSDLLRLHKEVVQDLSDTTTYPELLKDAHLRRENTLGQQEAAALAARKAWIASSGALRRILQLDESEEIHPEDVPVVALGGSGGGYRANLRHPLSMGAIDAIARSANGVYFQLAPLLSKMKLGLHPGPLDLYGTLVTSHIFFSPVHPPTLEEGYPTPPNRRTQRPDSDTKQDTPVALKKEWFQWSRCYERMGIDKGLSPMPLFTAVRHERPWKDWKSPTEAFGGHSDHTSSVHKDPHAWWQWFEISPCEFGSDELEGWVPTWSFGRKFDKGISTQKCPERSISLLLGLATSAPAGPLAAWLGTIYRNLPKGAIGNKIRQEADEWVEKNPEKAERLQSHHPVHAQNEANPFFGADVQEGRGNGFENSPRIHLVDAGMSNNLPIYTFCRPGRDVDIMLLGDFSSDVQKGSALERIQEFGAEKGYRVTPRASMPSLPDWPTEKNEKGEDKPKELSAEEIASRFAGRYAQVLDAEPIAEDQRTEEQGRTYERDGHQPQATKPCKMIYMPLLPHACQPSYDPSTAPFSSSYNLEWTPEQVETIRKTARACVAEGLGAIREEVRAVYAAKKAARLGATV